ncbi:protein-glutamate O-methyltransferase CheR [Vibrio sp.]|nr:protein-glutamate O-methyltransferase CheR [Vibrio sp.]
MITKDSHMELQPSNLNPSDWKELSKAVNALGDSEFEFTEKDFNFIREFIYQTAGIQLADSKQRMVYGRVVKRVRSLKLNSISNYLQFMQTSPDEREMLINALTTNKTHFFRESHHFDFVKKELLPNWKGKETIRIWSSASSTGEEPYSLACLLHLYDIYAKTKGIPHNLTKYKLLATDLDTNVLKKAKQAVYDESSANNIPSLYLKHCFVKGKGANAGKIRMRPEIASMVTFNQLNLLEQWPMKNKFDLIFCRNVMIYFDKPTQEKLLTRFHQQLAPNGYLIIGHSEGVGSLEHLYEPLGMTIYKKIGS